MTVETTNDSALDLLLAIHHLARSLRRSLAEPGLSPTQLASLVALVDLGPTRIGELASRVCCSQPTATTIATSLETAGLVRRVPDTSDGRAITLHITEAGRTTLMRIARQQADVLRQRLNHLDREDQDRVMAAVPVLRRMATDLAAPAGNADRRTTTGS